MAAKGARAKITLACTECKQRNYDSQKNKKNQNNPSYNSHICLRKK